MRIERKQGPAEVNSRGFTRGWTGGEGASGVLQRNVKRTNKLVPGIGKGDGFRKQGGQSWGLEIHIESSCDVPPLLQADRPAISCPFCKPGLSQKGSQWEGGVSSQDSSAGAGNNCSIHILPTFYNIIRITTGYHVVVVLCYNIWRQKISYSVTQERNRRRYTSNFLSWTIYISTFSYLLM